MKTLQKSLIVLFMVGFVVFSGCISPETQATSENATQAEQTNPSVAQANATTVIDAGNKISADKGNATLTNAALISTTSPDSNDITVKNGDVTKPNVTMTDGCEQNSVYFIYGDWCPFSQNMKPMVTELEKEGYSFVRVNYRDSNALNEATKCLMGIVEIEFVPEFVCGSNGLSHIGVFSNKSAMKTFAEACGA